MDSKIKQQMDAINALEGGMEEFAKKIPGIMNPLVNELNKTLVPKSKKDITVNGKPCSMSLLKDGRIMINLGTLDEAQKLYDESDCIDAATYLGLVNHAEYCSTRIEALKKENNILEIKLQAEQNKKWYQKIFK